MSFTRAQWNGEPIQLTLIHRVTKPPLRVPSEALDTGLPDILLALDAPIKPRKSIRISIPLARIKEIVRLMLPTRASRISIPFTIHASILDHGRRTLVCRSKADALVQRVDGVVGAQGEVALAADLSTIKPAWSLSSWRIKLANQSSQAGVEVQINQAKLL